MKNYAGYASKRDTKQPYWKLIRMMKKFEKLTKRSINHSEYSVGINRLLLSN